MQDFVDHINALSLIAPESEVSGEYVFISLQKKYALLILIRSATSSLLISASNIRSYISDTKKKNTIKFLSKTNALSGIMVSDFRTRGTRLSEA